jgi:parallel beta-helix repeat protein
MKNNKVQLSYLTAYFIFILFSLNLSGCSSPTGTPKGNLAGMVNLEGLSDHSNIIIALYDLAYLDTTIVRINNQYPQIGVHINQHTEFDHRLQSPIKTTETLADGNFEIKKIPTGIYNLVAIKDGRGFKYLYKIEIVEGENNLGNVIILYEEIHISGDWIYDVTVAPYRHLIIDDDTNFVPGTSLTIMPDAVIRINPGCDLKIYGNILAQGEEDHMFWVTSNDGFDNSLLSSDDFELYHSMEISSLSHVEDDLIQWGKWNWGNTCLLSKVDNLQIINGTLGNSDTGLRISTIDLGRTSNLNIINCANEDNGGILCENQSSGYIERNILLNNTLGISIKDYSYIILKNNYISDSNIGILISFSASPDILNNEIVNCMEGIRIFNHTGGYLCNPSIQYNNITAYVGIFIGHFSIDAIHFNNINTESRSIQMWIGSGPPLWLVNAINNFFYTNNEGEIEQMIFDNHDIETCYGVVEFVPFLTTEVQDAGIITR